MQDYSDNPVDYIWRAEHVAFTLVLEHPEALIIFVVHHLDASEHRKFHASCPCANDFSNTKLARAKVQYPEMRWYPVLFLRLIKIFPNMMHNGRLAMVHGGQVNGAQVVWPGGTEAKP